MLGNNNPSRRNVLKIIGGATAGVGFTGVSAAGADDVVEVNVGFDGDRGREAVQAAANGDVEREFPFDAMTIEVPKRALRGLENNSDVRYIEENGRMHALDLEVEASGEDELETDELDTADTVPWGIDRVRAPVAHDNTSTGSGANVAIIDTGIDSSHPDLQPNLGNGTCTIWGCSSWEDQNGHGTHVAGTVAAASRSSGVVGVAPDATIHAVKVLGAGGGGSFSDIAAGIEWSANQGHDVANLSLGGGYSWVVEDACRYAVNRGVLLVAAAGNDGCGNCVSYPAALDECLAVSATTSGDDLAWFSSYGPEIELAAPGQSVLSTYLNGGFEYLDGTSMASPHVAGAAALLVGDGWAAPNTRGHLRSTAENIGLPGSQQGDGLVNVQNALGL